MIRAEKPTREDVLAFSQRARDDRVPMDMTGLDLAGLNGLRELDFEKSLVHRLDLSMADIRDTINLDKASGLNEVRFLKTRVTAQQRDIIKAAIPDIVVNTPSTTIIRDEHIFVSLPESHTNGGAGAGDTLRKD